MRWRRHFPNGGKTLPLTDTFSFLDESSEWQAVPSQIITSCLTSLITGPGEMIRNDLGKMCYLGPIREVPQRNNAEVKSPDASRWANGLAAWDALYSQGDELIKSTNHWLASNERLDSGYRLELEEFRRINENGRLMAAIKAGRSLDDYPEDLKDILRRSPEKTAVSCRGNEKYRSAPARHRGWDIPGAAGCRWLTYGQWLHHGHRAAGASHSPQASSRAW